MNKKQAQLYNLLSSGSRYSVIDIAVRLHIGDPRSVIRDLRKMGIVVSDVWVEGKEGSRYKLYWIDKNIQNGRYRG